MDPSVVNSFHVKDALNCQVSSSMLVHSWTNHSIYASLNVHCGELKVKFMCTRVFKCFPNSKGTNENDLDMFSVGV